MKVLSYINAFAESCLASHLIKWLSNQIGMEGTIVRPNVSTPVALISELLWYLYILVNLAKFYCTLAMFCLALILNMLYYKMEGSCHIEKWSRENILEHLSLLGNMAGFCTAIY